MPLLYAREGAKRAADVVQRLEVARRQQVGAQRRTGAIVVVRRFDAVEHDSGLQVELTEDVEQKPGWHDDDVRGASQERPRQTRARKVVGGVTAVVVQDDGLAERARDDHGRHGRQQEPGVGRREHMGDVGPAQLPEKERPVPQLSRRGPHEFHVEQPLEGRRRNRIDWNQPRVDVRALRPAFEHPGGLHGVAAENAERRGDEGKTDSWRSDNGVGAHACPAIASDAPVLVRTSSSTEPGAPAPSTEHKCCFRPTGYIRREQVSL